MLDQLVDGPVDLLTDFASDAVTPLMPAAHVLRALVLLAGHRFASSPTFSTRAGQKCESEQGV